MNKNFKKPLVLFLIFLLLPLTLAASDEKKIAVFVALADNASQGIVPVPKAIGNGDDPEKNLYWGAGEGLRGVFDKSKNWKLQETKDLPEKNILRLRIYRHAKKKAILTAKAYKGSAIKECIEAFEVALQSGEFDLVVYIGHNGLMDFTLPIPQKGKRNVDCIVLCCKSEVYFKKRIEAIGCQPVLLTTQLMYPGSFLLEASAEVWLDKKNRTEIRESAGAAYATNQKISKKSAVGIFSKLD